MIITRKKLIPLHWAFYAQLPLLLSIYGSFVINAPFLLMMKQFIDNPAAIMGLISIEVYITLLGGPFFAWLSDRIWTRFGRRKFFFVIADASRGLILLLMPFAPNIWALIGLRWVFGFMSDFASMTQALIYEVVPPPQRGRMSGFFQSSIQFGNLVFFFLLIGRFDDHYFMGPFHTLGEFSGGTLMFFLAAMLLLGISAFEGLGFKEIKPPDMKTLQDDREPGQNLFWYFVKTFCRDVFAKDFLPLYLFMFITVMFGVGLGIFQPLLFTEQWGYSLQDMGNTVAVGVVFAVTLSLLSGWLADKWGKLQTFVLATIGSFCMNVFYTAFVAFQPDQRPTLWQIIAIGNIGLVFQMTKGVVTFPLMMEYVKRSRMGAANAGLSLFQALIRNSVTLFVGVWLAWWSIWFLPQAGHHVETTFPEPLDRTEVVARLTAGGVETADLILRPLHQYGVDGRTSHRWWIHRNDDQTHEWLKERKQLTNKLAPLENKLDSPLISVEKATELQLEIDQTRERLDEINAQLDATTAAMRETLLPVLEDHLYQSGDQIQSVRFENGTLDLVLETIETLPPGQVSELVRILNGPQYRLTDQNDPEASSRYGPDIEIDIQNTPSSALAFRLRFDPGFLTLSRILADSVNDTNRVFEIANILTGLHRAEIGEGPDRFDLHSVSATRKNGTLDLSYTLRFGENALQTDPALLAAALSEESMVTSARGDALGNGEARIHLELKPPAPASKEGLRADRLRELLPRFSRALPGQRLEQRLAAETTLRLTSALAERPFYITVPEHTPRSGHREREYEYFFSSQALQIATDLIGFGIVWFLLLMEKKGVVHRYGVEEDDHR
jgi:MFS family permease